MCKAIAKVKNKGLQLNAHAFEEKQTALLYKAEQGSKLLML